MRMDEKCEGFLTAVVDVAQLMYARPRTLWAAPTRTSTNMEKDVLPTLLHSAALTFQVVSL